METQKISRVFVSELAEQVTRKNLIDVPKFTGVDREALQELHSIPATASN